MPETLITPAAAETGRAKLTLPLKWHGSIYERRPILGFPGYFARADGSIWSDLGKDPKVLRPDIRKSDGRKRYTLRAERGRYVRRYGGEWVLLAFHGPRPSGQECCHEDGDCRNDAAWNVRWDTSTNNKADMLRHGTRQRGEQINTSKLTAEQIQEIRTARATGARLKALAAQYGVTETMISLIARRRNWQHV